LLSVNNSVFFFCEFKGTHFGFILFGYLGFGSLDV
jgi:hypothetical protein